MPSSLFCFVLFSMVMFFSLSSGLLAGCSIVVTRCLSHRTPTLEVTGAKIKLLYVLTSLLLVSRKARSSVTHVELCLGGIGCNLPGGLTLNCEQNDLLQVYDPCPTTHLVWCYVSMQQHLACWWDVTRSQLITNHVWGHIGASCALCSSWPSCFISTTPANHHGLFQCCRWPDKALIF